MSCKALNLKSCEIFGSTFQGKKFKFSTRDISGDNFMAKVKGFTITTLVSEIQGVVIDDAVYFSKSSLEVLKKGNYNIEYWATFAGIGTELIAVEEFKISATPCDCSDSNDPNFTLEFPDETIEYSVEVAIINIGSGGSSSWGSITGKPTTIEGFGITDAVQKVDGKQLTDQNYTIEEKNKLENLVNYNDSAIVTALGNKVDKEAGKGLSANDYTTTEKNKIEKIIFVPETTIISSSECEWVSGKYISTNGSISTIGTFSYCNNYIPIIGLSNYKFISSGYAIAWYDESKVFISIGGISQDQLQMRTFKSPINAKFCRVNQVTTNVLNFKLYSDSSEDTKIPTLKITTSQISDYIPSLIQDDSQFKPFVNVYSNSVNFDNYIINGNIIVSGDSTIASYAGGTALASIIKASGTTTNIAAPGHSIAQQLSSWNSLSESIKSNANFIFIQIGLNDLNPSITTQSTLIELQAYINKVKMDSPNIKIILGTMIPCRQRLINLYGAINGLVSWNKWKTINYFIENFLILNIYSMANIHTYSLSDANGNLATEFDTGDAIHENTTARKIIAYSWISAYQKLR